MTQGRGKMCVSSPSNMRGAGVVGGEVSGEVVGELGGDSELSEAGGEGGIVVIQFGVRSTIVQGTAILTIHGRGHMNARTFRFQCDGTNSRRPWRRALAAHA